MVTHSAEADVQVSSLVERAERESTKAETMLAKVKEELARAETKLEEAENEFFDYLSNSSPATRV